LLERKEQAEEMVVGGFGFGLVWFGLKSTLGTF